jgi:adenylate cyclase
MGEAVVGNIGTSERMDYTAIGNTVNTAARLESIAKPGQILLSESIYLALEGRIKAKSIGKVPLKGKSEEMTVYELEGIIELND